MPDGHGFSRNCPAVGCISRSDPPGKPPRPEVVKKLCSSRSGGEGAEIRVWRTVRNEVTVLELRESVKRRPRATVTYHDVGGNQQLSLAMSPVPGSALERSLTEMREAILANLRAAETIPCVP
jgi:hypothetical protein